MLPHLASSGRRLPYAAFTACLQLADLAQHQSNGFGQQAGLHTSRAAHAAAAAKAAAATSSRPWGLWAFLLGAGATSAGFFWPYSTADARQASLQQAKGAAAAKATQKPAAEQQQAPKETAYTVEEVAKHKTPETRIWVTYKDGVYDITDFVQNHPGGAQKIMLAAGGSVEPFWGIYQQHHKQEVQDILAAYRIGSLKGAPPPNPLPDPYTNEPPRHPALLVRSQRPYNAETPGEILVASPVTPNAMFYVRHHLPVPKVDNDSYKLQVQGDGLRRLDLSLQDLQTKFKHATVAATIECAGNRRAEMKAQPSPSSGHEIKGLDWQAGAIGTATWGGVLLRDVLLAAGLQEGDPSVAHIHFIGLDTDVSGTPYEASIPISKALSAAGDVLLAYEMNGEPLPLDHGGPLRVVVPGTTGARSVKWLAGIRASSEECQGHWQQRDYKSFSPGTDWDNLDWSSAPAIQEMPIVSAICEPSPGAAVEADDGKVTARGYAWSGGGRQVIRVDVSADGGATWTPAQLRQHPANQPGRAWAWALWEVEVPLPKGFDAAKGGPLRLTCKATDESCNTQPDSVAAVWNIRGLANNSWHSIDVKVEA